ncbi:MAG: GUN4 domain-containing protein [Nostoc sp.]|uniref:GUN4 domain-containing protein n=1 Tax=Nostoc sp. TaxID=1180 RepID=UPI002FF0292D
MAQFDVFLAHNSQDKPQVIEIARHLKQNGLNPWLDKEQILGGDTILEKVTDGIRQSKTGAFFISPNGLGNFQENIELYTVINWFLTQQRKSQGFRVIPILLPGVAKVPDKIDYLAIWRWIQFTKSNDEEALDHLIRSIRGRDTEVKAQPVIQTPDIPIVIQLKPQANQTDNLASEKGIDYTRLRDLLAAKNWREADQENYLVMIQAVGKKDGDWFTPDELLNFPCTDLRTIDRLWVEYSNGHFGFSVQKEIYLSVGGKADGKYYQKVWEKFGDRVGWRVKINWISWDWISYSDVNFDTGSPVGHLPLFLRVGGVGGFSSLASRFVNCNI